MLALWLVVGFAVGGALAQDGTPRVLFLSQFETGTVTQHAIEDGMEDVLRDGFANVSFEFLDLGFLRSVEASSVPWVELLELKYAEARFDVIVGYGPRAIDVALRLREGLGGPPVLHVRAAPMDATLPPGDAGIQFLFDLDANVDPILDLADPDRVILVTDIRNEPDRVRLETIRDAYATRGFEGEIDVWADRPLDDILTDAMQPQKGTVIHYLATFRDESGRPILPNRAAARLTEVSALPVFSLEETDIAPRHDGQTGTVGGYVISPLTMGRHVGQAILALASGQAVPEQVTAMRAVYDWRALNRWKLPTGAVPQYAVMLNRPPALWAAYRTEIWLAGLAFALLSLALAAATLLARQRDRAKSDAADAASRLAAAQTAAGLGIYRRDFRTDEIECDTRFRQLFGLPMEGPVTLAQVRDRIDPRDRDTMSARVDAAAEPLHRQPDYEGEYRVPKAEGAGVRWIHSRGRVSFDEKGPTYITGAVYDVTERREAEEVREVLLREMAHRAKNSIAVVQGIASQTFRDNNDRSQAVTVFRQRLQALASAHDLLARSSSDSATIQEIAHKALFEIAGAEARVRLEGPDLTLPSKTALGVTMALHELVTNAIKHGALSVDAGRVEVSWHTLDQGNGQAVELNWTEINGPPAEEPEKMNFGLTLLCRILPQEHDGEADLQFSSEGLRYRLTLSLPEEPEQEALPV